MSASMVREKLATAAGVAEIAMTYCGVFISERVAQRFVHRFPDSTHGWKGNRHATSAGPVVFLKSELGRRGILGRGLALEEEELMPLVPLRPGSNLSKAIVSPVARSKMFTTNLKVILPIDLTACRVVGFKPWLRGEYTK